MRNLKYNIYNLFVLGAMVIAVSSCKKDGNPNNLPSVSASSYEGKIDGYLSSDEVYPKNLVAYWSFDTDNKETKSGVAPTTAVNSSLVDGGVKGKALNLSAGYLYYATQLNAFKTDSLKSFTISSWVQILNNGSKRTMLFTIARPGIFNGSLDFRLNTNSFPSTTTNILRVGPRFTTVGGGSQDNLNNSLSPIIGADKWTHLVLRYDGTTGVFNIFGDGVNIGSFNNRGVGNNLFKSYEPGEIIIGAHYNNIPGKSTNADVTFAAMTGKIDEMRVYNTILPDAHIKALYNLGIAGK
ncbi:LamG-like jellyroll fold domain-containing protein [Pedobacter alpinus]|uniref:LamG-like jellyroll fold domain-containing protein n=1 Tax=Pedobacter alpinus TaxID=1590643 RepID=A0ABW5TQK0_9SPHI